MTLFLSGNGVETHSLRNSNSLSPSKVKRRKDQRFVWLGRGVCLLSLNAAAGCLQVLRFSMKTPLKWGEKLFHAYETEANERRISSAACRVSVDGFGFSPKAAERACCDV